MTKVNTPKKGKGTAGGGAAVAELPEAPKIPLLEDGFPDPRNISLWDYMDALTTEQWAEHMAYLYRTDPKVVRTQGETNHIEKYTAPFTMDDVKEEFGGKAFTVILKRDRRAVKTHRFTIEAPPKWKDKENPESESRTRAAHAEAESGSNELLKNLVGNLMAQLDEARQENRELNPTEALKSAVESSANLTNLAAKKSIEMVVANMPKQAGMTEMLGAFAQIQKLTEKPDKGNDLLSTITVLRELGLLRTQDQGSELDQIDKVLGIMDKLGHRGGGGGESVWVELARSFGPQLPTVVSNLAGAVENLAKISANNLQRAGLEKGVKVATAQPRPAVPAVEGAAAPEPAGAVPPAETPPAATDPNRVEAESIANFFKRKIVEFIEGGATGAECADWLDEADPTFATHLCQVLQTNPEKLGADPILSQITQNPRTLEFCREYVARIIELAAEDSQPAAVTAPEK